MILSSCPLGNQKLLSQGLEISLIFLTDGVGHTLADMVIKETLDGGLVLTKKEKLDPVVLDFSLAAPNI